MPTYIVLFGIQGAGKGTQAEMLAKKFNIPVISPGKIFREEVAKKTELGKRVEHYTRKGDLVPGEIVNEVVRKRLAKKDAKRGAIFDGYPRSIEQAEALDKMVKLSLVIILDLSDKEAIVRLKNRRQCEKSGHIYHLISKPPKQKGVCDIDGSKLYQRADDKPSVIRERIETFHEETEPLFQRYRKMDLLCTVDASGEIDEVFERLTQCL